MTVANLQTLARRNAVGFGRFNGATKHTSLSQEPKRLRR